MDQVRIVTDSTSDVPPAMAERLRITVVPAYVQIGNRSYRDGVGLSRERFYAQMPGMKSVPTTSVPPVREFVEAYRRAADEAGDVVALVVSSQLSSMYNVALLGAREVPELNVHVVDSGQVTMGLGWMVVAAAEAAASGRSVREIMDLIADLKPRVRVFAVLDTLEYLRRSGRVGWARARVAQVLDIKPIVDVLMGEVRRLGRVRTRRRAIERLVELTRALGPLERLAILHSYAPELETLRRRLVEACSPGHLLTVAVTTIIGAHVGPRALGVAAVMAG